MKLASGLISTLAHYPVGLALGAASGVGLCNIVSLDKPLVPQKRHADLKQSAPNVAPSKHLYANVQIMSGANLTLNVSEASLPGITHAQTVVNGARRIAGGTLSAAGGLIRAGGSMIGSTVSKAGESLKPGDGSIRTISAHPVGPDL